MIRIAANTRAINSTPRAVYLGCEDGIWHQVRFYAVVLGEMWLLTHNWDDKQTDGQILKRLDQFLSTAIGLYEHFNR